MSQEKQTIELEKLYESRSQQKRTETKSYLKLLFNDHFIVFLMIAFGGLVLLYRHYQAEPLALFGSALSVWQLLLLGILLAGLMLGHVQTYLEEADRVFLLGADDFLVKDYLPAAFRQSLWSWLPVQAIIWLLTLPLQTRAGLPFVCQVGLLLLLVLTKAYGLFFEYQKLFLLYPSGQRTVAFSAAIAQAKQQENRRYRFFALFAQVPGRSVAIKRRAYLDFILSKITFGKRPFAALAFRQLLRYDGAFNLVFRQWLLVILLLFVLRGQAAYWPVLVVLAFLYLAKRQLRSGLDRNDQVLWTRLLFSNEKARKRDFNIAVNWLLCPLTGLLVLLSLWLFTIQTAGLMFCTMVAMLAITHRK
ncbi:ABC transporter permease [Fructobacillus sp. M1-13]|uniref:ABC transporter permease n=1 Tax=Fructobacillus papyriferae TaxID=2713171 RepID=A0ABS5QPQ1_9LACO|nr:ABC transporter permease [Fructobacillus papyriferae]MBS9334787.1 hypothetical protein [Fructobacillus papyriferae]MCD2158777.1 ABC transporter permease [Fructobacillus papyriferae]